MKRRHFMLAVAAAPLGLSSLSACQVMGPGKKGNGGTVSLAQVPPPRVPREPHRVRQLGRTRLDDYAWLKAANWKAMLRQPGVLEPRIVAVLEAENAYVEQVMSPTQALQAQLREELEQLARHADDIPPPFTDGTWEYFQRYSEGADHASYLRRRRGDTGPGTLLLDAEGAAHGKDYYHVGATAHSDDHRLFAWAEDTSGAERYRIQVRDLESGRIVTATGAEAFANFVFSPDGEWLFWVWRDANSRPTRIVRRHIGSGRDTTVYEETDPAYYLQLARTSSRSHIVINILGAETSEVRVIPAAAPESQPATVEARRAGVYYDLDHWRDRFIIRTNADGATDFKLVWAPESTPGRTHWQTLLPERRGNLVTAIRTFKDYLVHLERRDANLHMVVTAASSFDQRRLHQYEIEQAAKAYQIALLPHQSYTANTLRFEYEAPETPRHWYACNLQTRQRVLLKAVDNPQVHTARYTVQRLSAPARDGQQLPVTVLMHRDTPLDGSAPLLLYGYGSYGASIDADFSSARLPLVERGWVYAIAHVRGGADKGQHWYLDARQNRKKNSFTDFVDCAEHLASKGYTRAGNIVAQGASAGGLLVGAALNRRPALWAGVIAEVPFVDVLNTMSDAEHPLVPLARPDWGDPLVDPAAYDYIESYSPYDQVSAQDYPPVFATTSIFDNRVFYWEPVKWVAKLRALGTDDNPKLVRVAMEGGHHGQAGRFAGLADTAQWQAFAIAATSVD